jgi:hypothetical protein
MIIGAMTQPAKQPLSEVASTKPAATPIAAKAKEHLSRSKRYTELSNRLLGAAEIGAEGLVTLIQEGAIRGRDLAVTVGILLDKVAMLEQRQDPPSSSVAELLRRAKELADVTQELERRNALPEPSPTTPAAFSDLGPRRIQ